MAKTITEKLNLHKYEKKTVLHMPEDSTYLDELKSYGTELVPGESYDLIFAFVFNMDSMKLLADEVVKKDYLNKGGYLFLAYPKKGNKLYPTYIHRDEILGGLGADEDGFIASSNIKFSRMVGMDETFTVVGLKEDSKMKNTPSTKASQCVDDYIDYVTQIERDLTELPNLLGFYQSLTPGYKKDWARYVYSAKQDATKEKRREEMKLILGAGYKSRELYRKDNASKM